MTTKNKVERLPMPNTFTPRMLIEELLDGIDDIEHLVVGLVRRDSDHTLRVGWSHHDQAPGYNALVADIIVRDNLKSMLR